MDLGPRFGRVRMAIGASDWEARAAPQSRPRECADPIGCGALLHSKSMPIPLGVGLSRNANLENTTRGVTFPPAGLRQAQWDRYREVE